MRVLAVERLVRAVVLMLVAVGVLAFRGSQQAARSVYETELPLLRPLTDQLGWNIGDSKLVGWIESGVTLSDRTLTWIAVGIGAYAMLQLIEAIGLWLVRRWGEYFAVVATGVFIPLEIYELTERITTLRVGALVVNVAAIVWLVWSKRLFGVRGGGRAYHAEHAAEVC